ncbi:MAG: murein biosynthesis integral membrane protein MurJ [Myxococcales bacterium]|nr:murein biosynthesis integral membrane protein MurJ [Myxococcales bacterium]
MSEPIKKRILARAAGLISAATMLSRLLGLIREQLFAALMGASFLADAFVVAFRIPNLLRDLFAEGALAQAFIPTFKADLKGNGKESAYELGNRLAGTLLVVIGIIVGTAVIFAPHIVHVLASDFRADEPGKFALTVTLTRIMMPFLLFVSLSAVAMGMLNAQDKYGAPALAPAMFNTASIIVGASIYFGHVEGKWIVIGWSLGTLLGGLSQLGVQLPPLWRSGFRPKLSFDLRLSDPRMHRIGRLMLPAIAGLAAVQVNIIVNTIFATSEEGAAAWLNYAFRFLQLPIGVFGVAIATVSTTRYADSAAERNMDDMCKYLVDGLRLVSFLTVPSMVGLIVLGEPVIELVYQRGAFGSADTHNTAAALQFYATGLVAYSAVKVLAPAFYAMDKARIAVIASMTAVAGNLIINIGFHGAYGFRVLAFGTAAAALLNFTVLYGAFHRHISRIPHLALLVHVLRVGVAGTVMGAAVWASHRGLAAQFASDRLGQRALLAFVPILVGIVVYAAACAALRIDEVSHYWGKLRRRR